MTDRDALLQRVLEANPVPNDHDLPGDLADLRPPLDLLTKEESPMDTKTRPRPTLRNPRWWRGPIAAIAATALALLIGGGMWLLRGDPTTTETEIPPATAVTETTQAPSEIVEPPPEIVESGASVPGPWTSHRVPGNGPPSTHDVASVASRFVINGITFTRGEVWGRGQLWFTVDDGLSWIDVANDGLFEEGHFTLGVVGSDAGGIAFGTNDRQGGTVIWHSDDGSRWRLVTTGDASLGDEVVTDGLALASGGYVLYGTGANCIVESDRCTPGTAPRLLLSPDGLTWELVTTPVTFRAIAEPETGELLAVGGRISEPTTWISHDEGRSWQLHGPDRSIEAGRSAEVWILEPTPYGLIAAGEDAADRPMLWISEDGKTFTPTLELPVGPEDHQLSIVNAIASGDGWVIAVGQVGRQTADLPNRPAMWASQDGRNWHSVPLEGRYAGDGFLADIAYYDSLFIVVGNHKYSIGNAGDALVLRWDSTAGPGGKS